MWVLLTLAVCGALTNSASSHPVHARNSGKLIGVPHGVKPVFLDRSARISGVEAEVRKQRLDEEEDMKTKELMSEIGKLEGQLEDAQNDNVHLSQRLAKEEVSFAQKEETFSSQIFEFQRHQKMADEWVWRLEMGFLAQLLVALVLGLSCCLCQCQSCGSCAPCNALVKGDPNMQVKHKWAASHRGLDPELKEKLRIRRMNLDGPSSPEKVDDQVGKAIEAPKKPVYFSLSESDAEAEAEKSSAFPAVFSEPRSPTAHVPLSTGSLASTAAPDQDSWWGSPVHSARER